MKSLPFYRNLGILFILFLLVAVGALVFTACSESSSPTEPAVEEPSPDDDSGDPGTPDDSGDSGDDGTTDPDITEGLLQINMTDAPTDEICALVVFIEELRVKKDGSPPQILSPTDGLGGFDLLLLQGGNEVSLGEFEVEAGVYQFIEMLLDETESYVVEKADPTDTDIIDNCVDFDSPLKIPSEKFKINGGPFEVGEFTKVLIDFDAKNSLKSTGNGKTWLLKADVSIAEVDDP